VFVDVRANHKKAYEGICYVLDHSKIKVGDVLLSTSDAWVSSVIRKATESAFSHAAMFIQPGGLVIEAVHPNVKLSSTVGMAIRDRKNVKVMRWADLGDVCDTQAIAKLAHSHVFKNYSRTRAALSKVPNSLGRQGEAELFCSQLIASSYLSCGLSITDKKKKKKPKKTHPCRYR